MRTEMTDLIDRFDQEYMVFHGTSQKRRVRQRKALQEFAGMCPNGLENAGADELRAYLSMLLARNLEPNTVRYYGNMIRPFFTWMYDARVVSADTLMQVRRVKDPNGATGRTIPRPYNRQEIRQFWQDFNARYTVQWDERREARMLERYKTKRSRFGKLQEHFQRVQHEAMTLLALHCGLRSNEIWQLTPDDVDPDNEYLPVKGKGGKNREVPMTPAVRESLGHWLRLRKALKPKHDSLWLSIYGNPPEKPMWFTRYQELYHKLGSGWQLHRFRHTCATEWLRAGVELELVQRLLGHATITQTLAYAEIVRSDIEAAMNNSFEKFSKRVAA